MEKTQRELYELIYVKCLGHCLAHSASCLIIMFMALLVWFPFLQK